MNYVMLGVINSKATNHPFVLLLARPPPIFQRWTLANRTPLNAVTIVSPDMINAIERVVLTLRLVNDCFHY